jgi:hypothetical protein
MIITTHADNEYCPSNDYVELNTWQLVTLSYQEEMLVSIEMV